MSENLVNGIKDQLLNEFQELYKIHQKGWRKKLKALNPWHKTERGVNAWRNISKRATGNEALRIIICDMKTINTNNRAKAILKKQGITHRVKV